MSWMRRILLNFGDLLDRLIEGEDTFATHQIKDSDSFILQNDPKKISFRADI